MRLIRILLGLTKKKECIIKKSIRLNNLFFYKIVNRFTVVNRCIISTLQYCIIAPFHSPFTISYFHIIISFYRKTSCDSSDNCAKLYYKNEFLEYVCNSGHHRTNCVSYNSGRVMVIVYLYRRFTSSIFIKIILCIFRYCNGWTT